MISKYATQLAALGYRKWYERRLTHAHGYLVLLIVALIMIASVAEGISTRGPTKELLSDAVLLLATGGIAAFGWAKYKMHMLLAEELAFYSTCEQCQAHGKLEFLAITHTGMDLRCKKCDHRWRAQTQMFAQDAR
jgi:hypothetical protein